MRIVISLSALWCLLGFACLSSTAGQVRMGALVEHTSISNGIVSIPNCGAGEYVLGLAKDSDCLIHAFDADASSVNETRTRVSQAGVDGHCVVVERLPADPLPYADNFVDVMIVDRSDGMRSSEIQRTVRPRGCVLICNNAGLAAALGRVGFETEQIDSDWTLARKPALDGADDWSHWSHGPDNNPVSGDTAIRAPYLTQWFGSPYYHTMPVVSTAAAGRVFIASGHIAHHDREIPTLNTLVARNGYNGRELWRRHLPPGYLVHRSAFIATEAVFYMIDGDSVLQLDPETGVELGRIEVPGVKGTLMWIAKVGDVLYVLSGEDDPPAEIMKVGATFRGWGWNNVDKNYSPDGKQQIRWGFGERLAAFDLVKQELLWSHQQAEIDSRGMAVLEDRLLYYVPASRLACLDRETGETLWMNTDRDRLSLIEEEARGLTGTPGFRTTAMLLATPVGIFVQGQKRKNVVTFCLEDGRYLWHKKKFHNNPNMLLARGKLFVSGIESNGAVQVIDPADGETIENLNFWKGSCTRMTGSPEALYCRGEGLGRYDFDKRLYTAERTARPGCNDGAIPANGLLYVGPWLCDCNLSILGQMVLGPAAGFDAHGQVVTDSHLEVGDPGAVEGFSAVDERDWPVYRADNARTASSAVGVPSEANVLWRWKPPADGVLQSPPVTAGGWVFTAGDNGCVRCLDAARGTQRWSFDTGGPILASPTIWQGRVFVGSGDGYVYCLDAATGQLLWRFRVAPVERRIMVYGRLASTWPVNSGILVHGETAYAAAGIVFRDGTHVVALDAASGQLKWHNGQVGKPRNERFELRAASALGTLATGKNRLWLASGNVVAPVSFDLETGEATIVEAQRVPPWNTVMVQKPEPAGRDIMVFDDRLLMHGGRLLYSGEGQVVSSAQISFRAMDAGGQLAGPAFTPVRHCAVPPAWDDELFVTPTTRYGDVVGCRVSDLQERLVDALARMVDMDKAIPGDSPEKWGQYNLIGKVFGAVERDLRSGSNWPVLRDNVYALVVAKNAVIATGRARGTIGPDFATAYAKTDGSVLWKIELPAEPRLGSLAVDRDGRVLVAMRDGAMVCVGR